MEKIKPYLNKKIVIACHDAGGADAISSWLLYQKIFKIKFILKGPAKKIFRDRFGKFKKEKIANIKNYNLLITGTSHSNSLEIKSIKQAKKNNVFSISFLDHWVNYKKRFNRNRKNHYPNEIIVLDKAALKIARNSFKQIQISLIPDYRKLFFLRQYKKQNTNLIKNSFLYFSSNYDKIYGKNYDKKILINFIKKNKLYLRNSKIFIRNHPSEKKNKFKKFIDNKTIFYDTSKNLFECISKYQSFFGSNSMALVYAHYAKKKIFNVDLKKNDQIPGYFFKKIL
jgi:hypothetical protein